jgi:hypothetical protein
VRPQREPTMKQLKLGYELSWRTKADEQFMKSAEWKKNIRPRILTRDDYTCQYCGYRSEKSTQVNHIDGNPKNNEGSNLETICGDCHKVTHSGLWAAVFRILDVYEKSGYTQNEIVRITRQMRQQNKSDEEIVEFLELEDRVSWKQDLKYLSERFGFISSRSPKPQPSDKPLLSEREQDSALRRRENW